MSEVKRPARGRRGRGGRDARRAAAQPYAKQRHEPEFGRVDPYTWSDDKTRQYAKPARADFGAFIRDKGFCLE